MKNPVSSIIMGAVLVFAVVVIVMGGRLKVGPAGDVPGFHIDEAHKLGETYFWHLLFEQHDSRNPLWNSDFYARTNPPVGKYIFGFALALAGEHTENLQLQSDFERHWQDAKTLRKYVPDGKLRITRWTSVLFAALAAALLFVSAFRCGGWVAGLLFPLLLIVHPDVLGSLSVGLFDSICLAFTAMIPLVCCEAGRAFTGCFAGSGSSRARLLLSGILLPALVIALAVGTKMNAFVTVPAFAGFMLITACKGLPAGRLLPGILSAVLIIAAASLLAWLIFIGINPHYYLNPVDASLQLLAACKDWTLCIQLGPGKGLYTLSEKWAAVSLFSLKSDRLPLQYLFGEFGRWAWGLLFVTGLVSLCSGSGLFRRSGSGTPDERINHDALLAWSVACIAATAVWLPLAWDRYFIIPHAGVCAVTAVGAGRMTSLFRHVSQKVAGGLPLGELPAEIKCLIRKNASAVSLTVILWAVVSFTSWIVDPALLSPANAGIIGSHDNDWYVSALMHASGGDFRFDHHRAEYYQKKGDYGKSADFYRKALEELDKAGSSSIGNLTRRAEITLNLSRVSARMGDMSRSAHYREMHLEDLAGLQKRMRSRDAYVDNCFNMMINERKTAPAETK